MRNWSR